MSGVVTYLLMGIHDISARDQCSGRQAGAGWGRRGKTVVVVCGRGGGSEM